MAVQGQLVYAFDLRWTQRAVVDCELVDQTVQELGSIMARAGKPAPNGITERSEPARRELNSPNQFSIDV